jgi:murein DD-endopeptidase MepM/ murein hydrolase activator NlpD
VQAQEAKVNEAKKAIADADRRTPAQGADRAVPGRHRQGAGRPAPGPQLLRQPRGAFDSASSCSRPTSTRPSSAGARRRRERQRPRRHRPAQGAKARLADLQTRSTPPAPKADKRRQDEQAQLDELAAARAEQAKIKAEWDKRLSTLHNDAAELSAADASLTAQIQQAQAEQAAREAAAAQARAAAQTSSSTSSTSGAPGTTGARASGSSSTTAGGTRATTAPAPATQIAPSTGGGYIWPIAGRVSQEFGGGHPGMDIFAPCGTPTYASGGTVIVAGMNNGGYGNLVVVDHGGGITTAYAHHASLTVSVGQTSPRASRSATRHHGHVTGCHLHFEVRVNGSVQNPRRYLPDRRATG